jgi:SAM-dependent methyltransferase
MPAAYRVTKTIYRRLVPRSLNAVAFGGHTAFSRSILRAKAWLEQGAAHDELYDEGFFLNFEAEMGQVGPRIAESLVQRLHPKSVIDVGCGSGCALVELNRLGVESTGLEYADAGLALCRRKGLNVYKFDLEKDVEFAQVADVALSTEVAEHLPESAADRYVDLLCKIGKTVVMTAATPGQGGTDHVNEQPNEYWIQKFMAHRFDHDPLRDQDWRADWHRRGVDVHRANNVMVFTRSAS